MAGLDDLLQPNTQNLGGTDLTFTDADTLVDSTGAKYRLSGVSAGEALHPGLDSGYQAGSAEQTSQVSKLANQFGYNRLVPTGEVDDFGRQVVDLQDKQGRSFKAELAKAGVLDIHTEFDQGSVLYDQKDYAEYLRTGKDYKPDAWDEAASAVKGAIKEEEQYTDELYSGIRSDFQISDYDRTDVDEQGNSLSPLSTAWDTGMLGVSESLYGVASLIGDSLGIDSLKQYGEIGGVGKRYQIGDQGKILTDYKDVDGFGTAVQYIANNAVLSIPYLGITTAAALTAPITGGASLLAPAAVYTGQAWNEMGQQIKDKEGAERSASIAIATGVTQAALDRIGLAGIVGAGSKQLYTNGVKELVKRGLTKEQAEAQLANATRRELAELSGDLADIAKQQVGAKKVTMDLLKRGGVGAVSEAGTEAMQEAIAGIGADIGSGQAIDWNDIQERAIQGAVAGGALGGAFSVPGTLYDVGAWTDLAVRGDRADPSKQVASARYAEEEQATRGYVPTIQELAAETRAKGKPIEFLQDRAERHRGKKKQKNTLESLSDALHSIPSLFVGSTAWIFRPELQQQSRSARILADMFGGNRQRIYAGSNFENSKHHKVSVYKNMIDTAPNVYLALNGGKQPSRLRKKELSDQFYTMARNAIDKEGNFNPDLIPEGPQKQGLVKFITDLQKLSDQMYLDQKQYNNDLGYISNYLLKYKAFDQGQIHNNRNEFIQKLKKNYALSDKDAQQITDNILNLDMDIDEAFSVVKGGPQPKQHKKRTLALSENPEFAKFMERDMFSNISSAAKSAARYTAYQEFIGDNAGVVSKLLDQMEAEGVDKETVDKVAAQLQDYLDAESGNYKRPTSELGKKLEGIQKNFIFISTIAGLPLATISSFVELALTQQALTANQMKNSVKPIAKEFAEMVKDGIKYSSKGARTLTGAQGVQDTYNTEGKQILKNLGFYDWDVGAATTTGVSEINKWKQGFIDVYFKAIGLQGWTNFTRAARAAIAGDYLADKSRLLAATDPTLPKTNEVQEAEQALRNLGVDPFTFPQLILKSQAGTLTEAESAQLNDALREAQFNFVNQAVALPQAGNRPLIYQDPRFALFTQFQGFISTFTANHIPRLWGEYVARGTPAMKYNAFAVMTTMVMLGFASQYLKDLIKYGTTENPYLDDDELLQRGIRASGLLGTGERILDQFFPLYETRSKDAGEWLFNTTTGESPALSNLANLGRGLGKGLSGDYGGAVGAAVKSTPLGPFTGLRHAIEDKVDEWNYGG